jgi:hypothetical protein
MSKDPKYHTPVPVNVDDLDDLLEEVMIGFQMSPTDSMVSPTFSEGVLSPVREPAQVVAEIPNSGDLQLPSRTPVPVSSDEGQSSAFRRRRLPLPPTPQAVPHPIISVSIPASVPVRTPTPVPPHPSVLETS